MNFGRILRFSPAPLLPTSYTHPLHEFVLTSFFNHFFSAPLDSLQPCLLGVPASILLLLFHKLDHSLLRPKPLRTRPPRDKPAMPAVLRRNKPYLRIPIHPRPQ